MAPAKEEERFRTFAHNIAWLRQSRGLSKKEMSRLLGIDRKSLDKIEKGEIPPNLGVEIVFRIEEYFSLTPREQLEGRLRG